MLTNGYGKPQSRKPQATVNAVPAESAIVGNISGSSAAVDYSANTVTLQYSVSGNTNGRQVVSYDPDVLHFVSLNGNTAKRIEQGYKLLASA